MVPKKYVRKCGYIDNSWESPKRIKLNVPTKEYPG